MAKPGIVIQFDWSEFDRAISALAPPKLDKAVALGLVDTAKSGISKAATAVARHTGLRSSRVKKELHYDRVNVGDYETNIRSSSRFIPMIEFKARQVGAGVRAAKPWGRVQVFKSAFIATMPSGHRGVFRRRTTARLPVREMYGPSIHSTFIQPDVADVITTTIKARLVKALTRRIKSEMRRR